MRNEQEENQAKKLQQLFAEVTNEASKPEIKVQKEELDFIEVDVLSLPPRKEVHQSSKGKLILTLNEPFTRLMFVFFIIIAIILLLYFVIGDQVILFFT